MKKVRNLQKLIPLLPLLLLAILFIFLPIISMIQKSFLSPETGAFTLNNYKNIFTDSIYHPAIEVVQIQFNYVDYDDPSVQSRKCYSYRGTLSKEQIGWLSDGIFYYKSASVDIVQR